MRSAISFLLAILLANPSARAQEISEAAYLGGLDGGIAACAATFPEHAAHYRQAVKQLLGCRMSDAEIAAWRARLRDGAASSRQYAEGYAIARRDLSDAPGNRRQQCASLDNLRCDSSVKPSPRQ